MHSIPDVADFIRAQILNIDQRIVYSQNSKSIRAVGQWLTAPCYHRFLISVINELIPASSPKINANEDSLTLPVLCFKQIRHDVKKLVLQTCQRPYSVSMFLKACETSGLSLNAFSIERPCYGALELRHNGPIYQQQAYDRILKQFIQTDLNDENIDVSVFHPGVTPGIYADALGELGARVFAYIENGGVWKYRREIRLAVLQAMLLNQIVSRLYELQLIEGSVNIVKK